jgi:hypothetical protein
MLGWVLLPHGYKVNQTHGVSLREGALGYWLVEHVLKRLNVAKRMVCGFVVSVANPNDVRSAGLHKLSPTYRAYMLKNRINRD